MTDPDLAIRAAYSVDRIIENRNLLAEVLRFEYRDKVVTGAEFQRFVDICEDAILPLVRALDRSTLVDSLRHLAGTVFTEKVIVDTAHRLMGNLPLLRCRRKVVPWHHQRFFEWVPIQVLSVRRSRNEHGQVGAMLTLKCMAGTPCPLLLLQWWSLKKCRYASREFGFSRPKGSNSRYPPKFPYVVPEQLTTLRFLGLVDPAKSTSEPMIVLVDSDASTRRWNLQQLKRRARIGFECPQDFPRHFPCHTCPIGYVHCIAATHRYDYEERPCPACDRKDAVWDIDVSSSLCIQCYMTKHVYPHRPVKDVDDDEDAD